MVRRCKQLTVARVAIPPGEGSVAVKSGTLYQWRIRACNPGGCSAYTLSPETRA